MSLTLRVQSYRKQAPAVPVERRFDQLGGTIGRAAGNDLELPDPGKYISRNHSKIDFADGRYTLMDLGANPSWINDRPVGAGKVAGLEHGDRLMIGDYVLEVLVDQPAHAAAPLFSTETSEALPFQAQPAAASASAPPQFEPVSDTLAGMKVLDVGGHFDGLAAPSADDPLGLGLQGEVPTRQQIAAYRGSEADHVAPQYMPLQAGLLPGLPPSSPAQEAAVQPYPLPPVEQPQVAAQGGAQAPGQYAGLHPGQMHGPIPGTVPAPGPFERQASAAAQAQGWPAPLSEAQAWPASIAPAQQGAAAWPAAAPPHGALQHVPQHVSQDSPLPGLPQGPEPTVLVVRSAAAAPTAPLPPAIFIPDDYDPLADIAPPRPQSAMPAGPYGQLAAQPALGAAPGAQQGVAGQPHAAWTTLHGVPGQPHAAAAAPGMAAMPGMPGIPATPGTPGIPAMAGLAGAPAMSGMPGGAQYPGSQHNAVPSQQASHAMPGMYATQGMPPQAHTAAAPQPAWPDPAQANANANAVQHGWPQNGVATYPYPPHGAAQPGMAAGQGDAVLQALLRGMGLSALQLNRNPVDTAELAGAMLREAVSGTMAVLMARAMTKRESRLDMTVLGAQANNPLKFFPDAESALAQMLTSAMSGYMPPVKAIGSAFDDLKAHELAVIAGMRAALKGVMARFDPAQIEAREPEGVVDKVMAAARKARMWDNMKALYDDIVREADDDFQHLFGEKFSAAYEDQIGRLHRK